MRKNATQLSALALLILMTGCAWFQPGPPINPEAAAKQTLEATTQLVDKALQKWGDYVALKNLTPAQRKPVVDAVDQYNAALTAAKAIFQGYHTGAIAQTDLEKALKALDAAANAVVNVIAQRAKP